MADVIETLGTDLSRRSRRRGSLLVEAIAAARRDPEVAAALTDGIARREAQFVTLLHQARADGEVHPAVSAEAVARFSLMAGLGALVMSVLDLPPTDDDDWSRFMNRLVGSLRTKETA
jgi:hypothetical protein